MRESGATALGCLSPACDRHLARHGLQGIVNRLAVDEAEVEERVFVEAITNQYESREAIKYLGGCPGGGGGTALGAGALVLHSVAALRLKGGAEIPAAGVVQDWGAGRRRSRQP